MSILREGLFKSSFCIDKHELDMRKDIDEQIRAATALQTYVDEVVAGFKTLLLAQKKFRDGAVKELQEVGQAMEAPFKNFGHAFRHAQEVASRTTVGLHVHQQKLTACRSELARTDEVAAMLQFTGAVLQADNGSEDHEVDSQVLANTEKRSRWQKREMEGVQLAKLTYAAKVQLAFARSTLEACVSRRKNLVELARKALEAVAQTVPQVDETDVTGVFDMTASSNSTVSSYACNEPWNPFSPDLMEVVGYAMLLNRQVSISTLDTTVGSCISQHGSDTSGTFASGLPEDECAKNPFNVDSAKFASMTSQPWAPSSQDHVLEEWANNPLTQNFARAADAEEGDHIPMEHAIVQPVALSRCPSHRAPSTMMAL